jgi:hypothetical protein
LAPNQRVAQLEAQGRVAETMLMGIQRGNFVEVRGRPWLVEAIDDTQPDLSTLRLSCIADDAQGEQIEVLWDAEIGARVLDEDTWSSVGRGAPDTPEVLAAHLRAVRWAHRHRCRPRSPSGAVPRRHPSR